MLQNYSLNSIIQCMRFEELEAKLRAELKAKQEAAEIEEPFQTFVETA